MLSTENENLTQQNKENNKTILELRKQIKDLSEKISENNKGDSKEMVNTLKRLEKESQEAKKNLDEQVEKYQQLVASFDKKVSEYA